MNAEELENKIKEAAEAYYTGQSIMSDSEFDKLVDELKTKNPSSSILSMPGWGFVPTSKTLHKYGIVGSLSKTKTTDFSSISSKEYEYSIACQPKYDGLSCVAYFESGKLTKAVTRGNGYEGIDITNKYNLVSGSVDKLLDLVNGSICKVNAAVRGELVIHNDNWNKVKLIHPEYKNQRNAVAGLINQTRNDDCLRYVRFIPYKLHGLETNATKLTFFEVVKMIDNCFPFASKTIKIDKDNMTQDDMQHLKQELIEDSGYPCDGLVLSSMNVDIQSNGFAVYKQIAYKFEDEKVETKVKSVQWNLTRTGKLVPVAILEPVELEGATISKVTCFNAKYVLDNRIDKDAYVEIQRSNQVIPDIQKVTIEAPNCSLPKFCPVCGKPLSWKGVNIYCENPDCQHSASSDLHHYIETIANVDGIAWSNREDFINILKVESILDIYKLGKANCNELIDINCSSKTVTAKKYKEMIDKLFGNISIDRFLVALNIPNLGWTLATKLAQNNAYNIIIINYNNSISGITCTHINELYNISGIGPRVIQGLQDKLDLINNIIPYITLVDYQMTSSKSARHTYCVTGSLSFGSRKQFEEHLLDKGWKLTSVKDAECLICNDVSSVSSKMQEAKKLGKPILSENDFLLMIE